MTSPDLSATTAQTPNEPWAKPSSLVNDPPPSGQRGGGTSSCAAPAASSSTVQRLLDAEARYLLHKAGGDATKATPWRDQDLRERGLDDATPGLQSHVVEVPHVDSEDRGEAA